MRLLELKDIKLTFFDRPEVISAIDTQSRNVLAKFGSFVRQTSRQLIRTRKRSSRPGEPPTNKTGKLKYNIQFGFDLLARAVHIGPVLLPGRNNVYKLKALEYGGKTPVNGNWKKMKARPFMQTAFDNNIQKLPSIWAKFPLK